MGIAHLSRHDEDEHCRRIGQLWKSGTPEDRRLATLLAECTEAEPCRSAACIHCGRDFQALSFDLGRELINDFPGFARGDSRF